MVDDRVHRRCARERSQPQCCWSHSQQMEMSVLDEMPDMCVIKGLLSLAESGVCTSLPNMGRTGTRWMEIQN